jgi:hypothetical protein
MSDFTREDVITGLAVDFTVDTVDGPPQVVHGMNNATARVKYKTNMTWEFRHAARRALLGQPFFVLTVPASNSFLSRAIPHDLGILDEPLIYCIAAEPQGRQQRQKIEPGGKWETTVLDCRYEGLPFQVLDDADVLNDATDLPDETDLFRYVGYTTESRSRLMTVRGGSFFWGDPAHPGTVPAGALRAVFQGHAIRLSESIKVFTWYGCPFANFPWNTWDRAMNKVNDLEWVTAYGTYRKETMLLENWKPEIVKLPGGIRGVNATAFFRYLDQGTDASGEPRGWNWLPDPARGGRLLPVVQTDPDIHGSYLRMISTATMPDLFKPVAPV